MFRRHHSLLSRRASSSLRNLRGKQKRLQQSQFQFERLEDRNLLAGDGLAIGLAPMLPQPPQGPQAHAQLATGALLPVSPFPLNQTFQLHSDPTATKTVYLDFDGFITRNTDWNTLTGLPNIVTPAFSLDADYANFSDAELNAIQLMWEQVSEDYRPFDVDVTTVDPGIEALRNTGGNDTQWGIRVVVGGGSTDWLQPTTGMPNPGIAYIGSFTAATDTPCFVLSNDFLPFFDPGLGGSIELGSKYTAEAMSHETGHTLGLVHDGQIRFWQSSKDMKFHQVNVEYYGGHPENYVETMDAMGNVTGYQQTDNLAPTSWAPIMGQGYNNQLTQFSKGEYPGANNIEDDLNIISTQNGFGYRADDHGSTTATADPLAIDPSTAASDTNTVSDEGIIEKNTDVDDFSFTLDGFGGLVDFDITTFQTHSNLDVLAKILDSQGNVIATSNPRDYLDAGSKTLTLPNIDPNDPSFVDPNLGWRVQLNDFGGVIVPTATGTWTNVAGLLLPAGTYYLSVEGTGKPITYIDPAISPGPIVDPPGAPDKPQLQPDTSDWGYSNYGSLGYYDIKGTINKNFVVGVDFDAQGGAAPINWNKYAGGDPTVLSGLISEAGAKVPYSLSVSTSGNSISSFASTSPIDPLDVPAHGVLLNPLDGYLSTTTNTLTFTWGNLTPSTVYQVFVFGHSSVDSENQVTVTGGQWNGVQQTYSFKQIISPGTMVVNNNAPGSADLQTFALFVISDENGNIKIDVTGADGKPAGIAGLAINITKTGSISGEKFNDANGDQIEDSGESGLAGWVIYLDQNNDGQLNMTSDQNINVPAPHVPQPIVDATSTGGATTKNELQYVDSGTVLDLTVTLDITHTYDADLRVWLVSPTGTKVKLFANIGSFHDNFTNTTFDDTATVAIDNASAPYTGTFRPEEALAAFNGENAQGTWTLQVEDDSSGDVGVLNSWSITVKTAGVFLEPYAITDDNGDYSFTNLPAGQYFVREHFSDDQKAAGWTQSIAPTPVTVRSGADITGVDFGNWIPVIQEGSISGQIFNDLNTNGIKDPTDPGLSGWIAYIDSNGNGVRDAATSPTIVPSTDVPKPITDFSTVNSQVQYGGFGTVFKISVTLDITHSFVGDLDAFLISPTGRQVELFTGVGGQYNDFHNLTLADDASRDIADIGVNDVPYTGTWRPEGLLSDFIGDDAAGTWTLQIRDTAFADEGTLNSWSLNITAGEEYRTTDDDGNYSFQNVPAGTYVVREEPQLGWSQITPATTDIAASTWTNGRWAVAVVGVDDINYPEGPDSHRNVKNVNFANQSLQPLLGDFDHSGSVNALDYLIWRHTLGQQVTADFAGADANGNGVVDAGDYTIWRGNFGKALDDFGNDAASANHLASVPATKHGTIEVSGDVDWFAFDATQGTTYDLSTALGTLTDTSLRLIGTDGTTQLALNDNATGLASLVHWTAPADGTYYAEVRGVGNLIGTYTFGIQTSSDDHGDFAGDATPIVVPSSTAGDIETGGDHDWFKFNALAGTTYSIDVKLDTLADSQLSLRGTDGTTLIKFDDDGGGQYASHITWTFATAGSYYLDVNGYGTDIGTYHVTISVTPGSGAGMFVGMGSESGFPSLGGSSALASGASSAIASSGMAILQPVLPPAITNSNSDAALLAWVASQSHSAAAPSDAASALHAMTVSDDGDGSDSIDSVFDRIGADAFAESLAV